LACVGAWLTGCEAVKGLLSKFGREPLRFTVLCRDQDGIPISDVLVAIDGQDIGFTKDDGSCLVVLAAPGEQIRLKLDRKGYATYEQDHAVQEGVKIIVVLKPEIKIMVNCFTQEMKDGRLVDIPIAGVEITVQHKRQEENTSPSGSLYFSITPEDAEIEIIARKPGYVTKRERILYLPDVPEYRVDIQLLAGGAAEPTALAGVVATSAPPASVAPEPPTATYTPTEKAGVKEPAKPPTATHTATTVATATKAPTSTKVPTSTKEPTSTRTPTATATDVPTKTATVTKVPTSTKAPSATPTSTSTKPPTASPTKTPTTPPLPSRSPTRTATVPPKPTYTPTATPTVKVVVTSTPTATATVKAATATMSPTRTATRTVEVPSPSPTPTATSTKPPAATSTPTVPPIPTSSPTATATPTRTPTLAAVQPSPTKPVPPTSPPVIQPGVKPEGAKTLTVTSKVPAIVKVDGANYGKTPATIYLKPGTYRVEAVPEATDLTKQTRTVYLDKDTSIAFDEWKKDLIGKADELMAEHRKSPNPMLLEQATALLEEAVAAYARQTKPSVEDRRDFMRAAYQLGLIESYEKKNLDRAEKYFDQVLSADPTSPSAQYEKGYILLQKKLWTEALQRFETAMKNVNVYQLQADQKRSLVLNTAFYRATCLDELFKRDKQMDSLATAKAAYESYLTRCRDFNAEDSPNCMFATQRLEALTDELSRMTLGGPDAGKTKMFE